MSHTKTDGSPKDRDPDRIRVLGQRNVSRADYIAEIAGEVMANVTWNKKNVEALCEDILTVIPRSTQF